MWNAINGKRFVPIKVSTADVHNSLWKFPEKHSLNWNIEGYMWSIFLLSCEKKLIDNITTDSVDFLL